jgi:hypothetical protein
MASSGNTSTSDHGVASKMTWVSSDMLTEALKYGMIRYDFRAWDAFRFPKCDMNKETEAISLCRVYAGLIKLGHTTALKILS